MIVPQDTQDDGAVNESHELELALLKRDFDQTDPLPSRSNTRYMVSLCPQGRCLGHSAWVFASRQR
jgi:hypothetical protein